jgi:hypothetical protein
LYCSASKENDECSSKPPPPPHELDYIDLEDNRQEFYSLRSVVAYPDLFDGGSNHFDGNPDHSMGIRIILDYY